MINYINTADHWVTLLAEILYVKASPQMKPVHAYSGVRDFLYDVYWIVKFLTKHGWAMKLLKNQKIHSIPYPGINMTIPLRQSQT